MSQPSNITGTSGNIADVSSNGEAIIASRFRDLSVHYPITAPVVPGNILQPKAGHYIVLTGFTIKCSISGGGTSNITFYSEDSPTGISSAGQIHLESMEKGDSASLSGIRLKIVEGNYLNVLAVNNDWYVTWLYHYEPVIT